MGEEKDWEKEYEKLKAAHKSFKVRSILYLVAQLVFAAQLTWMNYGADRILDSTDYLIRATNKL